MKPFDRRRQVYKKVHKPQRQRIKLLNYLNHGEAKHKEEPRASRQTQPTNAREQTKHKSHAPIRGTPRQIEIPRDFYHCIPPDLTSLEISLLNYALLRCKTCSLEIWPCKIFDKYHVCRSVLFDTWWYLVSMEWFWLIYDGTVEGSSGWYLVVLSVEGDNG